MRAGVLHRFCAPSVGGGEERRGARRAAWEEEGNETPKAYKRAWQKRDRGENMAEKASIHRRRGVEGVGVSFGSLVFCFINGSRRRTPANEVDDKEREKR